jgi:hypothetical protein
MFCLTCDTTTTISLVVDNDSGRLGYILYSSRPPGLSFFLSGGPNSKLVGSRVPAVSTGGNGILEDTAWPQSKSETLFLSFLREHTIQGRHTIFTTVLEDLMVCSGAKKMDERMSSYISLLCHGWMDAAVTEFHSAIMRPMSMLPSME